MKSRSTKRLYDNILVLDKKGEPIFKTDKGRVDFYLKNDLAFIVQEQPKIIQLKIDTNGPGRKGDSFYFQELIIQCVVCGNKEELTHHHIVPYCYRRFLTEELKTNNHYDVVLLCVDCHEKYECEASKYRQSLCDKYNVSFNGTDTLNRDKYHVKKAAAALVGCHKDKIPTERKQELLAKIKTILFKSDISQSELEEMAVMEIHDGDPIPHGKLMMEAIDNLFEFIKGWRQHFIDTMQPKFMPEGWTVDGRCELGKLIKDK